MNVTKVLFCVFILTASLLHADEIAKPTPAAVKALGIRVADWQIANAGKAHQFRRGMSRRRHHPQGWIRGVLYAGLLEFSQIVETDKYINWVKAIGEEGKWQLGRSVYHADDHTVGQAYLSLYRQFKDPAMLKPTQERFDWILENRKTGILDMSSGRQATDRWAWGDALFMAPPVWARLARITGDKKYLLFMDEEYRATYDFLYHKEENLFFHSQGGCSLHPEGHFSVREKNGNIHFWSRGNGWVFCGLALLIPELPEDWETRAFYIDLFKRMALAIKNVQREDGTWSMGLLGSPEDYPTIDTSGTAFHTFGMAWGINQGILDRATYEPVVLRAWQAMAECVHEDGLLGYVQQVGHSPGKTWPDVPEEYGVGAFLSATAEVYKLVGGEMPAQQ